MNAEIVVVFVALFFIWLGLLSYFVYKNIVHYNKLVGRGGRENLQKILEKILEGEKISQLKTDQLQGRIDNLEKESIYHVQQVGIVRFNPFEDTGGDQSFVLAILDGRKTGIVLTSLHSRGVTRWYAKNVKEGRGVDHELSKEEENAIKNALRVHTKHGHN